MEGPEVLKAEAENTYFAVRGFDMFGGDLLAKEGFSSQDEAIVAAKGYIAEDPSLCGMLSKNRKGTYTVYVKEIRKTNPTRNEKNWDRCKTVFYGSRMSSEKAKKEQMKEKLEYPRGLFEYFLVQNLDMCGGDFYRAKTDTLEQAYLECVQMLDYDASKCGMVLLGHEGDKCKFYVKNPRKCNPSASKNHLKCTTIFVGREV